MNNLFGNDKNQNTDSMGNRNIGNDSGYINRAGNSTDLNTNNQDKALVGIFATENETLNVIGRLKEIGYRENEITVIAKDKDKMDRLDNQTNVETKTQGDADKVGKGAVIGGALGGVAGALPALGLLAIPGIGPILAAGPIAAVVAGVVAGGVAGGLVGALAEMGATEEDAKAYEHQIEQGKIVVLVENRDNLSDKVYSAYNQNNSVIDGRNRQSTLV